MDISPQDRDMAIRTILGEVDPADPDMGRAAVGSVILNRLKSGKYGDSINDVVLSRGQFEPWATRRRELMGYSTRSPEYQHVGDIFDALASGKTQDPTGGATHFYSPRDQRALGRQPPSWANEFQPAGQIGGHAFFYGPGSRQTGAGAADDLLASWPTGPAKGAPAPTSAPAQAAPATAPAQAAATDEDLLGSWPVPDTGMRPDATGKQRIVIHPAGTPEPIPLPADASKDDMGTYVARLLAEHQDPGILNTAIRGVAGVGRGIGDVADSLAYGINAAGRGGANALANLGIISPETAANVGSWAQGEDAQIRREQALFNQNSGTVSEVGRIGGQLMATAPLLSGPAALAARGTAALGTGATALGGPILGGAARLAGLGAEGAGFGAGASALTSAASDEPLGEQMASGGVTGGLANLALPGGALVGRGVRRALFGRVDPETARLAQTGINTYGIPITAGQMSENTMMRIADSVLQRLPFTGYARRTAGQQTALNRQVARTFGEDANRVTPDVMDRARTRIGQVFDDVAQRTTVNADHQLATDLSTTLNHAQSVVTEQEVRPIANQIRNIMETIDPAAGTISGDSYQALTRRGAPLDVAMHSPNPNIRHYAGQIREAIDGALERSAAPDDVGRLQTARQQWRAMKTVEDLAEKAPTGNISPSLLLGAARSGYGGAGGMAYGRGGALPDLGRVSKRFIQEPNSSNTAERAAVMKGLQALAGAAGFGGAAYELDPDHMQRDAILGALSVIGGRGASSLLRSRALANAMIRDALTPGTFPAYARRALPGAAPLGALTYRSANAPAGQ